MLPIGAEKLDTGFGLRGAKLWGGGVGSLERRPRPAEALIMITLVGEGRKKKSKYRSATRWDDWG